MGVPFVSGSAIKSVQFAIRLRCQVRTRGDPVVFRIFRSGVRVMVRVYTVLIAIQQSI